MRVWHAAPPPWSLLEADVEAETVSDWKEELWRERRERDQELKVRGEGCMLLGGCKGLYELRQWNGQKACMRGCCISSRRQGFSWCPCRLLHHVTILDRKCVPQYLYLQDFDEELRRREARRRNY